MTAPATRSAPAQRRRSSRAATDGAAFDPLGWHRIYKLRLLLWSRLGSTMAYRNLLRDIGGATQMPGTRPAGLTAGNPMTPATMKPGDHR